MSDRKIFTLNGRYITTIDEFHDEVQKVLCPNFKGYGRGWDAFNDILRGGFDTFELDEKITLVVKSKKHLRKNLGVDFLNKITKLVKQHKHIEFIME